MLARCEAEISICFIIALAVKHFFHNILMKKCKTNRARCEAEVSDEVRDPFPNLTDLSRALAVNWVKRGGWTFHPVR